MSERTQCRLAAFVSADVVGYSRLMGVDETGTLAALRAHRAELIDAQIADCGELIVKTMGDGVNIAARLEALAEPGGIAISARVCEDVRDPLKVTFTDTGEQSLKTIARPIRVWHWSATEGPEFATSASASEQSQAPLNLSPPCLNSTRRPTRSCASQPH